jgi:hypothetical protein
MSPSPIIAISGHQGGHAYNVAEPNHCNQWPSRRARVQCRRAQSLQSVAIKKGTRTMSPSPIIAKEPGAPERRNHKPETSGVPGGGGGGGGGAGEKTRSRRSSWKGLRRGMSMSIGMVSPSVRMHLPVHASSSEGALRESIKRHLPVHASSSEGALRESIKRHLEQGALTGIMLDSRRGLALNGNQWQSMAIDGNQGQSD